MGAESTAGASALAVAEEETAAGAGATVVLAAAGNGLPFRDCTEILCNRLKPDVPVTYVPVSDIVF